MFDATAAATHPTSLKIFGFKGLGVEALVRQAEGLLVPSPSGEGNRFSISPGGRLAFSDGVLSQTSSSTLSHLPIVLFIKGEVACRSQHKGKKGNHYPNPIPPGTFSLEKKPSG